MVMTFIKKMLAMLFIVLMVIIGDLMIVYAVDVKTKEALENAVDGAIMVNMDNYALAYSSMDTVIDMSRDAFYQVLKTELDLNDDYANDYFFRHGVQVRNLYIGWYNEYPIVRAQISVKVDTLLLKRLMPEMSEIKLDNYDHLYWQWS